MEDSTKRRKRLKGLTIATVAIVAFSGGIAGVYLGVLAFRGNSDSSHLDRAGRSPAGDYSSLVNIRPGDLFPLEDVTDSSGRLINMADLLAGQPAVFIFISFECEPCFKLLEMWQKAIVTRLYDNVEVYVVLQSAADGQKPIPVEYAGLLRGMRKVDLDLERWQEIYSLGEWPTVVSIDGSGFVRQIQIGFIGFFEYGLLDDFMKPSY